jgi:DnaJ-class molecular chaperone
MRGSLRSISLQRANTRTGQTETLTFKVRIPVGVQEGQTIRVPGKGHTRQPKPAFNSASNSK